MEETLKQILNEMKVMHVEINELKETRGDIKEMHVDINELKEMHGDIKEMRVDISELKEGQSRLEAGQEKLQKNLVDSLGSYTDKIVDHFDDRTEVLNKRVYKLETEFERQHR